MFKLLILVVISMIYINYSLLKKNEIPYLIDTYTTIKNKSFNNKITIGGKPYKIKNGSLVVKKQTSKIDEYKEKILSIKNKFLSKIKTYKTTYGVVKKIRE